MNLELLETFGQNFPEDFDGLLDCVSIAVTCSFSRRGTMLAVGCNDGRIVLWDFLTRGITKIMNAHVHPIWSISWNRNGHKILSSSTDNVVSVWHVLSGECDKSFRFPAPVLKVQFHPRNSKQFIVCPMKHAAVLMNIDGTHKDIPLDEDSDLNIVASFDRRGDYIYTGNAKGKVLIFQTESLQQLASFRVTTGTSSATAIKSIEFARRGKPATHRIDSSTLGNSDIALRSDCFLVNSADRIIRVYDSVEVLACGKDGEPEPIQKLQDLVNKTLWKSCCFSGDGEYIVAGSARQHSLYIWEVGSGNLVKILHGRKGELLLDVVWHPVRPIIASISSGVVSIWAQNQVENWSAFAPDFKELDENIEYEERESEFDIEDEDKETEEAKGEDVEDEMVDVVTYEPITAFMSSDEEGEDDDALLFLPVAPEIEESEEGWVGDQPPEEQQTTPTDRKRKETSKDSSSPKKKKQKTYDVELPDAPKDEIHPFLSVNKKASDRSQQRKAPSRPKSNTKPHKGDSKSKHKDKSSAKDKEKDAVKE